VIGEVERLLYEALYKVRRKENALRAELERLNRGIEELDKEIERETAELKRIDTEGFSLTDITGETPETIGGRDA
jgi:predicted  nucleic acid-binding Zn-ribbon protein